MSSKAKLIIASCAGAARLIGLIIAACMPVTIKVSIPQLENLGQIAVPAADAPVDAVAEPAAASPDVQPTDPIISETGASSAAPAVTNSAEPAVVQPAATQPAATQPAAPQPAATQPAATQPANGALSKDQIVSIYNTAVNKVKKEASKLTRNYKHVSAPEDQLELPSAIKGLGKTAIGTFVKGTDTPESWTAKEDMQIVFPVGGTDYSSHLTADMVETAACEDTGSSVKSA